MVKKIINILRRNWLLFLVIIFLVSGPISFGVGLFYMLGFDKEPIGTQWDWETHKISEFGEDLELHVKAKLMPEYNQLYSFDRVEVELTLRLDECYNCNEIEEGIPFWFFYEKIDGSGSGGSFCSDNFYSIIVKPGEEKTVNGWVTFTGEGIFRHGLVDNNLKGIHIRLAATNNNFTVYSGHILQQVKSNRAIHILTYIALGASFFALAFVCFQSHNNIENKKTQEKDINRLLNKLNDIKKSIDNLQDILEILIRKK